MKKLMTGNEAVARGAYEAGVKFASAYPGTPSTEILENIALYKEDIKAEWAPNEKVAVESAAGASIAGARTVASMKHVGLNVAADPLFTIAYTGVNGGFVIITADEPGQHSSQNEQDNRNYAKSAKIPMLEPSDSQEAKDMIKKAFEISEKYDTPVLYRLTTRLCHSKSIVECNERKEVGIKEYVKDANKYVTVPAVSENPKILNIKTEDLTAKGYRVTVTFSAPAGVKEVQMPTWTAKNDQDDIVWHIASISGNTATFYVPVSSHNNESGVYYTHIYVYDVNGAYALEGITVRVPAVAEAPVIKKIETSNVTTAGYTVKVTFSAQLGVKEVKMPTWTEKNGQDDIVWHVANISGNTATAYIPTSAHNNEVGNYITHVYVVDKKNNEAVEAVYVTVK
mgnify:CR=1 FL=1